MCANESSTNTSIQDSSSSNGDDAPVPPSSSANEDEAAAKDAAPAATSVATDRPRRRATPEEPIYTQAREPRPSVRPRPARTRRAVEGRPIERIHRSLPSRGGFERDAGGDGRGSRACV